MPRRQCIPVRLDQYVNHDPRLIFKARLVFKARPLFEEIRYFVWWLPNVFVSPAAALVQDCGQITAILQWYTVSQKNVPPLVCYNFDIRERILIFLAEMLPMNQAIKRRFTMPPQITCASALPDKMGKHENRIFHWNAASVHCQNSARRSFISSVFWLRTRTHAAVCLPKSCNQCSGLFEGMVQEKGSRERRNSWTVLHKQCICTNAMSSRKKNVICDEFDSVWHLLR